MGLPLEVPKILENQLAESAHSDSDDRFTILPAGISECQLSKFPNSTYNGQFLEHSSTDYFSLDHFGRTNYHDMESITEPANTECQHTGNEACLENNSSDSVVFVAEHTANDVLQAIQNQLVLPDYTNKFLIFSSTSPNNSSQED